MEKQWHITIEEKLAIDMQDSLGYKFDSNFEVKMAVTLNFLNIPFSFKATKFYFVAGEKAIAFTPDFVLDMYYEDKRVIIDTHGSQFTKQRPISKMHNFMQSDYSNNYYFILVTDRIPGKPSRFKRKLKELGYKQEEVCDKVWYIPYNHLLREELSIKNQEGSLYAMLRRLSENARTDYNTKNEKSHNKS